jgi:hypothetical protein
MEFQVPQFIEHKPKIVGPLTFGQFIFIGIAGGICFFLWFSIGKTNFFLFVFISIVLFLTSGILAFGKMGGRPLPQMIGNYLKFSLMPKRYLWKTKEMPPRIIMKKMEPKKEEEFEETPLKIGERSKLKNLSIKIETKMR